MKKVLLAIDYAAIFICVIPLIGIGVTVGLTVIIGSIYGIIHIAGEVIRSISFKFDDLIIPLVVFIVGAIWCGVRWEELNKPRNLEE